MMAVSIAQMSMSMRAAYLSKQSSILGLGEIHHDEDDGAHDETLEVGVNKDTEAYEEVEMPTILRSTQQQSYELKF
jgi:hypothetical protein